MAKKTFGLGRIALGGLARKFGTLCGVSLALACVLVAAGCARSVYDLGLSKCEKLLSQMEKGAKAREKTGNAGSYFEIAEGAFEDFYATFQTLVEQVVTLGKEPSNKQKERFRAICKRAVGLGYDEFAQVEMLFWSSEEIAQAERAMQESGGGAVNASTGNGNATPASDFEVELNETDDGAVIIKYIGYGSTVVIPAEIDGYPVVEIGEQAFNNNWDITSVTIPGSVTTIGDAVFRDCGQLASITIPDSVTSIGNRLFWGCAALTQVNIPASITVIGEAMFVGCKALKTFTIHDSVTTIGHDAFSGCAGLASITIPDSVTAIGTGAFYGCAGLTSIAIPAGIESIAYSTFVECVNLVSVTIPASVTSIEREAFMGCTGLTSLPILTNVTSIGKKAFVGCIRLTSITIPSGVTSIEYGAFGDCIGATSVTIPASVTSIGDMAFNNCSSVTSVVIADGASIEFGDYVFGRGSNLSLSSKSALKKAGYSGDF